MHLRPDRRRSVWPRSHRAPARPTLLPLRHDQRQATCRVRLSNTLAGYKPSHIDTQYNITITRLPYTSIHYILYEFLAAWAACAPGSEKERLYTKLVNREAGILINRYATPAVCMKREIAGFTDDGAQAFTDLLERRLSRASNRDLRAYLAAFEEMRSPGATAEPPFAPAGIR
ncbi:hypothetical protein K525DRAFT_261306 [Schizophyllum commune Loenen D]|nr:hypothetical protein K525DRAFT_261306 [Schizophyllum commune Loenen D]